MAGAKIKPFFKGERVSSAKMNTMWEWLEKLSNITVGPPFMISETPTGISISDSTIPPFYAQITSGSNPYAWKRMTRSGTAFVVDDASQTGTTSDDPAYEINGNIAVPVGTNVLLTRDTATGQRLFQLETC